MKIYSMKEVAKRIKVPPGTLRQWEKDLNGFLEVPRSKQGARMYTDSEIELLLQIKQMMADNVEWADILEWLKVKKEPVTEGPQKSLQELETVNNSSAIPEIPQIPVVEFQNETETVTNSSTVSEVPQTPVVEFQNESDPNLQEEQFFEKTDYLAIIPDHTPALSEDSFIKNADHFFLAMDNYRESFLSEVKTEIRSVLKKEVIEEVKKEINSGALRSVKSISDSIYKSHENTKFEIQGLAEKLEKSSELTTDSLQYLSNRITNVSLETTEEIFSLSKQLAETTEELGEYVDQTNNELYNLTETLTRDREFLEAEREQYRHEIRQREAAFQEMLSSFRDVASSKDKRWWKFWSR